MKWIAATAAALTFTAFLSAEESPNERFETRTAAVAASADEPETSPARKPEELTARELADRLAVLGDGAELRKKVDHLSRLRITGYLQAQYVHDQSSADELSGNATRNRDQFSVRRGRVKFTYQALPTSRFVIQPDISSSGVTLKDGYVELIEPWTSWKHTLTAGQFIWPFGFELPYSSSARELPERSRAVRALFAGERDRGVMLSGRGWGERLRYQVAVVNGTGTVQSNDTNRGKDLVGRVGYSHRTVSLGASLYDGTDLVATAAEPQGRTFDKERQGFDIQWKAPLPGLTLRGEYLTGRQPPAAGTTRTRSREVDGWNLYAIQSVGRHQLAVRGDRYDPDRQTAGDAVVTVGGSYTFQWDTNSRLMFAYENLRNERHDPRDDLVTIRYQFSF